MIKFWVFLIDYGPTKGIKNWARKMFNKAVKK
jgi:hypothetical protein